MDFSILYPQQNNLCCFDPASALLAVAVGSNIVLREADSLRVIRKLNALGILSNIEFSPDSRYLLGASYASGSLEVWPVHSASIAASAEGHYCSTSMLDCENRNLISEDHVFSYQDIGEQKKSLEKSYDIQKLSRNKLLSCVPRPTPDVAVAVIDEGLLGCARATWHPSKRCVLSWSGYGMRLGIWSLLDRQLAVIREPKHVKTGASFRCDGRYLAVLERVDCKDIIGIYDGSDLISVKRFAVNTADAIDLAWSPDGHQIAVWDYSLAYMLEIYTPDGRLMKSFVAYENNLGIRCVAWSPNSIFLAIGSYDQKIRIINSVTFSLIAEFDSPMSLVVPAWPQINGHESPTLFREHGSALSRNKGEDIIVAGISTISATETWSGYEKLSPPFSVNFPSVKGDPENPTRRVGIGALSWSNDSYLLAAKNDSSPNLVNVYSMKTLQLDVVLQHKDAVRNFSWHPCTTGKLAICTGSKSMYFWSVSINNSLSRIIDQSNEPEFFSDSYRSGREIEEKQNSQEIVQEEISEADDLSDNVKVSGVAEILPIPEVEFSVQGFFWSPDGLKMVLMDRNTFCVGFEIKDSASCINNNDDKTPIHSDIDDDDSQSYEFSENQQS